MTNEIHVAKVDGRVRDTRKRILKEAENLYLHGGYAGINLQELAKTMGLTKAALFHHFDSKQSLFFEMQLEICESHRQSIEAAISAGNDTRSRLRNVMEEMSKRPFFDPMKFLTDEIHQLNPNQQQAITQAFYTSTRLPIAQIIENGVNCGELKAHNLKIVVMSFLNLLMLLPTEGNPVTKDMPQSERSNYLDELLEVFLGGIAQPVN